MTENIEAKIPQLDTQRQKRAREYARLRRRLWGLEIVLGAAYLGLWVGMGWGVSVRQALAGASSGGSLPFEPPWWVVLLLTAVALGLPWSGLTLPLSYYRGFVLPHRYGLSTQTLRGWISDLIKAGFVSLILGVPLLVGLYAFIGLLPEGWWFWAAAGYSLFTVVLATLAPILLMPIFYRIRPLSDEHAGLRERLVELGQRAGTRVEGVFSFDMSRRTRAANAALAGLGRTRRILLGDTLLAEFSDDEIETVLAHEFGHHVHRDIPLSISVQSAFNFLAFFLASWGLAWSVGRGWIDGPADPAGLPILSLLIAILGFLTLPLSNAYSRWRENLADTYALESTHKPGSFVSAMTRLANQNLAEVDPERWAVLLLHSHPPLRARIQRAEAFSQILNSPDS